MVLMSHLFMLITYFFFSAAEIQSQTLYIVYSNTAAKFEKASKSSSYQFFVNKITVIVKHMSAPCSTYSFLLLIHITDTA